MKNNPDEDLLLRGITPKGIQFASPPVEQLLKKHNLSTQIPWQSPENGRLPQDPEARVIILTKTGAFIHVLFVQDVLWHDVLVYAYISGPKQYTGGDGNDNTN